MHHDGRRSRLHKFIRLPARRRVLLARAMLLLVLAELATRVARGNRLTRLLGRAGAQAVGTQTAAELDAARDVSWAIAAASRQLPWQPVCLPQALAARWLLQQLQVRCTLFLGIARADARAAHAWVCVGPLVVTGAAELDGCTVVATFA